jgi:hypothetical protein
VSIGGNRGRRISRLAFIGLGSMSAAVFKRRDTGRQTQMAVAAPPGSMAPRASGELAKAAEKFGMSPLEAAAYDRLGVRLA